MKSVHLLKGSNHRVEFPLSAHMKVFLHRMGLLLLNIQHRKPPIVAPKVKFSQLENI